MRGSPTDPGKCRCLLGLLATWLTAGLVPTGSAPQSLQEPGCSGIAPATAQHHSHRPEQTLSQLSPLPVTRVTESSSHPLPQAPGAMPAPPTSSPVPPGQPPGPPDPASSTSPPLPPLGAQALFSPRRTTAERGEAHSFPTPTGSSRLSPQGNPTEQDHDPAGLARPCPARGAHSTHSSDAALRGDPSARMLPSFASWNASVVHALAAGWAEPGGGSATVLTRLLGGQRQV